MFRLLTTLALLIATSSALGARHTIPSTPALAEEISKGAVQIAPDGLELEVLNPDAVTTDSYHEWVYGMTCNTTFGSSMKVLRVEPDRLFVLYTRRPGEAPNTRRCPNGTISTLSMRAWREAKQLYEVQKVKDDADRRDRAIVEELQKEQRQ